MTQWGNDLMSLVFDRVVHYKLIKKEEGQNDWHCLYCCLCNGSDDCTHIKFKGDIMPESLCSNDKYFEEWG